MKSEPINDTNYLFSNIIPYIKLMRPHHYLKNFLIFLPIIYSRRIINFYDFTLTLFGFSLFCLAASIVYILNDIKDVDDDRCHEVKCHRPIASGEVSIAKAYSFALFLMIFMICVDLFVTNLNIGTLVILLFYIVINIAYSSALKHRPIIDVAILVMGFLLRVLYGAILIDVEVSAWLYLTVMSLSFFLGLGKRRNELMKQGNSGRKVLKYYTKDFLDKNMYMCLAITIVFYSLWCIEMSVYHGIVWTVPIVILIFMRYSLVIEGNSYGDPVDVLLGDKWLLIFVILYGLVVLFILYAPIIV